MIELADELLHRFSNEAAIVEGDSPLRPDDAAAEPRISKRGIVGVLSVDEAQLSDPFEACCWKFIRTRLDGVELVEVRPGNCAQISEHALGAVAGIGEVHAACVGLACGRESIDVMAAQRSSAISAWREPPRCDPISRYRNVP